VEVLSEGKGDNSNGCFWSRDGEKFFAAENKKDVEKFRASGFTSTQGIIQVVRQYEVRDRAVQIERSIRKQYRTTVVHSLLTASPLLK
jgi:hypothetical protein